MADDCDFARDYQAKHNAEALANHANRARETPTAECVRCGEGLTLLRQKLGACRCVACQRDFETAAKHRRW